MFPMGPGNPPAVQVWTRNPVQFRSRSIQKPDQLLLARQNPYPYRSICGFCWVCLDPSVLISGSRFQVFLFTFAFRYPTVKYDILTLVHHCLCFNELVACIFETSSDMLPATFRSWVNKFFSYIMCRNSGTEPPH